MRRRRPAKRTLVLAAALVSAASLSPLAGAVEDSVPPTTFGPYQAYATGSWPESVAVGDFTGDGRNDVALSTSFYNHASDFKVLLFVQRPDGSLAEGAAYDTHGAYANAMGLDAGDLNGDGRTDLAVATASGVDVLLQGTGGLRPAHLVDVPGGRQVEIADVDGDGLSDLMVNTSDDTVLLTGRGDGTFGTPVAVSSPWAEIEVADVTGDGRPDLVGVARDAFDVVPQRADGSFGPPVSYRGGPVTSGYGIAVADVTGDGRNDVAVSGGGNRPSSLIAVFPQTTAGTLSSPVVYPNSYPAEPLEAGDLNGDGRADLVTVNGGWYTVSLYVQQPDGNLADEAWESVPYASHYNHKGLALGDVNSDHVDDIVIADYNHGLVVIRSGPLVRAWGLGSAGQVGDGTTGGRLTPVVPRGSARVADAAAGGYHSVAVDAKGAVAAWGMNHVGQLGDGEHSNKLTPTPFVSLSGVANVAPGVLHTLARKSDGTVWAWGWNHFGQLGTRPENEDVPFPVKVFGLSGVKNVSAGGLHSLALKEDGTVWAWGVNNVGQVGAGPRAGSRTPVRVTGLSGVVEVAAGAFHNLALKADGTVWTWGWNYFGQLGVGSTTDSQVPVRVPGLSGVVAVAAGYHHSLALRSDGTVWAWGLGHVGQLGNGSMSDSRIPVQVKGLSDVQAIGGGGFHSLASTGGSGWAWGWNHFGQLGNRTTTNSSVPVQISGIGGVKRLSGGVGHTVAVASAARPYAVTSLARDPDKSRPAAAP